MARRMWICDGLLWAVLVLIPVVTFAPVIIQLYRRASKSASGDTGIMTEDVPIRLKLWQRCLCVLLSYMMLLSPVVLEALAQGTIDYTNLHISTWGSSGTTITYTYDDNGSVESKVTNDGTNDIEIVDYTYNLQNRLETVTTAGALADLDSDTYVDDRIVEVTTYTYNPAGIRVKSESINYNVYDYDIPATELWEKQYSSVTDYLVDPYNHTGYAQVLEEITIDYDDLDDEIGRSRIQYTIGDDVISQTESTWSGSAWVLGDTKYLLYDGHGSTRQLLDHTYAVDGGGKAIIDDCYSYDGYGVMLGGNPATSDSAATNLLYAGEQFDANLSQYYLRARYYNQNNGRFNRIDPFAGSPQDPQSLHKYLYCHANPINGIDPSGQFFGGIAGLVNNIGIRLMVGWSMYGGAVLNALTYATYVTGALWAASNLSLLMIEWGYLPQNLQGFMEAVSLYSGIGFVLSLSAFLVLSSTLGDPRQARPPQRVSRLDRDRAVDGRQAPRPLSTSRPVAQNQSINAEKNRDVMRLQQQNASQIRVDQRQVQHVGGDNYIQKGLNRPDCQGLFQNKPNVHIEYDTRLQTLIAHRDRILANDPTANVILKWFDSAGNYTIVP